MLNQTHLFNGESLRELLPNASLEAKVDFLEIHNQSLQSQINANVEFVQQSFEFSIFLEEIFKELDSYLNATKKQLSESSSDDKRSKPLVALKNKINTTLNNLKLRKDLANPKNPCKNDHVDGIHVNNGKSGPTFALSNVQKRLAEAEGVISQLRSQMEQQHTSHNVKLQKKEDLWAAKFIEMKNEIEALTAENTELKQHNETNKPVEENGSEEKFTLTDLGNFSTQWLHVGDLVELIKLRNKFFNGKRGIVTEYDSTAERWSVDILDDSGDKTQSILVKPYNMHRLLEATDQQKGNVENSVTQDENKEGERELIANLEQQIHEEQASEENMLAGENIERIKHSKKYRS